MEIIPQTLKQRAIAAYEAAQERKAHEEAEREAQRRNAHVARLQALCTQILNPPEPMQEIRWAETSNDCPFAEVDGMLFSCYREPLTHEPDGIYLRTIVRDGSQGAWRICCLEDLGEFLSKRQDSKLARIEDNRIVPAHQSAGGG